MAWTGTVKSRALGAMRLRVEIEYTNGTRKVSRVYRLREPSDEAVKSLVIAECARLEALESNLKTATIHAGDTVDTTQPAAPVAEAPDPALEAFRAKRALLRKLLSLADDGLIAKDDQRILDLQKALAPQVETYLEQM